MYGCRCRQHEGLYIPVGMCYVVFLTVQFETGLDTDLFALFCMLTLALEARKVAKHTHQAQQTRFELHFCVIQRMFHASLTPC